jgi:hypothetical protein
MGWEIEVYTDHGIGGAKCRNGRPAFEAMCTAAAKRQFDIVMAWSVHRLGRSLQDLRASYPSYMHCASTYPCTNKASTRLRPPERRYSR